MRKDVPTTSSDGVQKSTGATDFEKAITTCGFGFFNVCLLGVALSALTSTIFTTSTVSYLLPTAECDLHLNLMNKGLLNAIPFAGMILSAISWGYIADTMGRRNVLIYGLLVDGVFVLFSGFSQNIYQLLALKFFDGFVICGPFAVIMAYLPEFHDISHRSRILMFTGMIKSLATLTLPLLAYALLPLHILVATNYMKLHTWHFFILITAIVPLAGGILHTFFPESPKFLMSQGRNEEALKCLQLIYAMNSGNPKESYPITKLVEENPEKAQRNLIRESEEFRASIKTVADRRRLAKEDFIEGLKQLKPLCTPPLLYLSLQVYSLFFCVLLGLNTIRLWLPQLFATMVEYEDNQMGVSSICAILNYSLNKTKTLQLKTMGWENCDVHITPNSYTNNIIVSASSFCGFLLTSLCVNKVGNNFILRITLAISFVAGTGLYFSKSSLMTLMMSSLFITACGVSSITVISVSVNLFPTNVRTMVVIMVMTFGRCGSLLGNILFPYFISMGCVPPFILIGGVMLSAFMISIFLPKTSKVPLK